MFKNKSVLVTGGTGSFGKRFIETLLKQAPDVRRIIVFSRDEYKQSVMREQLKAHSETLRFFIGDVRDGSRLRRAFEDVNIVIHAAAMKQVDAAEYNPLECIKTNVYGAANVVECALEQNVSTVIALSTDKAAAPINLYGATKLCSDKLFVAANFSKGPRKMKFTVVRYGNVMGSRGSVMPFFLNARKEGVIPITDEKMTRFNITLDEGVALVNDAIEKSWGGEIIVPKIPSYRILDVAQAIAPECKTKIVGIRPGEKIHEEMITETDSLNTYDLGKHYAILPANPDWPLADYVKAFSAKKVPPGFRYNSGENTEWLSVEQIRKLIEEHVDNGGR